MSFNEFILEAPFTVAFAVDTTANQLGFSTDVPNVVTAYPSRFDSILQFEDKAEALSQARIIDSTVDKSYIYGPLPIELITNPDVSSSSTVKVEPGVPVNLQCTGSTPVDPSASIKYSWFVEGVLQKDATSNSFIFTFPSDSTAIAYTVTCVVDVVAADNWVDSDSASFFITL